MNNDFSNNIPGTRETGRLSVTSPWSGQVIGSVPQLGAEGVDHALSLAYDIYSDRSRWLPVAQRLDVLKRAAAIMQIMVEELACEAAREGGKPLADSRVEVDRAIDGVFNTIECLRGNSGSEIPMGLNSASQQRLAMTSREPIGVVVAVSAFNHPLNLIVHQVMPALAAGCPFIVKPAEDTPLSCFRLIDILHEAGLPPEYGMALMTENVATAEQLVSDARVGFFSFIGYWCFLFFLASSTSSSSRFRFF